MSKRSIFSSSSPTPFTNRRMLADRPDSPTRDDRYLAYRTACAESVSAFFFVEKRRALSASLKAPPSIPRERNNIKKCDQSSPSFVVSRWRRTITANPPSPLITKRLFRGACCWCVLSFRFIRFIIFPKRLICTVSAPVLECIASATFFYNERWRIFPNLQYQ